MIARAHLKLGLVSCFGLVIGFVSGARALEPLATPSPESALHERSEGAVGCESIGRAAIKPAVRSAAHRPLATPVSPQREAPFVVVPRLPR